MNDFFMFRIENAGNGRDHDDCIHDDWRSTTAVILLAMLVLLEIFRIGELTLRVSK